MEPITFALQFKGHAAPVAEAGGVMKATTAASSCNFTTVLGRDGVMVESATAEGGSATFESVVTMVGDGSFVESGTITYGDGGTLVTFSTTGQGSIGPSADQGMTAGAVIWHVTGGAGEFADATGYITSNFLVGQDGEVTDNQFAVIFPKAR